MAGYGAYDLSALGRRSAPLLVVLGGDADPIEGKKGGFRHRGNSDIYKLIPDSVAFDELNLSRRFSRREAWPSVAGYECILNLVTDADQHPETLGRLGKLLRGYKGRVINRPDAVLRSTRDKVARRLAGIEGLLVPRAVRLRNPRSGAASAAARREGLNFPLIVRHAGTHTGRIVGRLGSAEELDAAVAGPGEFIMTEFVDFRSADGLYRKYRVFFFGGRRVFKHLIAADSWSIHARERFEFMAHHPRLIEEELAIIARPEGVFPTAAGSALDAIPQRMGLDYFGVDFGIAADGRAILFEANATMNFFPVVSTPPFQHITCVIPPAREALMALLGASALHSLAGEAVAG